MVKMDGNLILWNSKKQSIVTTCANEAECIAYEQALKDVKWITQVLDELSVSYHKPIPWLSDSQTGITMASSPQLTRRTRHISLKYHFVKEAVKDGLVEFRHTATEKLVADALTKALPKERFVYHKSELLNIPPGRSNQGVMYDSSSVSEVAHIDMINGTTEDDERPAKERVSTEELLKPRCDLILA